MMLSSFLIVLNLLIGVEGFNSASKRIAFIETQSKGHKVSVSNSGDVSKWIVFPEQNALHLEATSAETSSVKVDQSKLVPLESFWHDHSDIVGISSSTEMKLKKEKSLQREKTVEQSLLTYDQWVDGVRVFGGEFRVTTGSHGGVVNAHGLPFRPSSKHHYDMTQQDKIRAQSVNEALQRQLYEAVEHHIYLSRGRHMTVQGLARNPITAVEATPELVWFSPEVAKGKVLDGSFVLAYFLHGVRLVSSPVVASKADSKDPAITTSSLERPQTTAAATEGIVCDVFIDASMLHVTVLIDKHTRYSSPFTSPLGRDVEVIDEPTQNVIFDSTSTFPTGDGEMDLLVTTSLYVSNIMYSASGGLYETWAGGNMKLNIEANLNVANAYFDGDWGIHFGTGYVTDDVVGHEWGHGYMETANELIYQYQSGAMDEAFADILGETVDILNGDTNDVSTLRTGTSPIPPCTVEHGGSDVGNRWSMGEEVTGGGGGSLRDMYSPTCHYDPDTTYSGYYYCGAADHGGVHWNSGVVNRLYSVLVDGGVYDEVPGSNSGPVTITPIGMTKAFNIFWDAYQQITPVSQFFDLAAALNQSCSSMIGGTIYVPNLLDTTLTASTDLITAADCDKVKNAIAQTGMMEMNLCSSEDLVRSACASGASKQNNVANEPYSKYLGDYYYVLFGCGNDVDGVTFRVLDYDTLDLATTADPLTFTLECIEFAYLLDSGTASYTIRVFIDSNGGDPDFASMTQVGSDMTGSVSYDDKETELATVTPAQPFTVTLPSSSASVVVTLTVNSIPSDGYFWGRGRYNPSAVGTHKETFVAGLCYGSGTLIGTASFFNAAFSTSYMDNYQWYVQLTKSDPPSSDSPTSSPSLAPTALPTPLPTVLATSSPTMLTTTQVSNVPTSHPTAHPTNAAGTSMFPTIDTDAGSLFIPQSVEFGNLTTIASRKRKDEWMTNSSYICDTAHQRRFNVLAVKTVIQSPGEEMMNLVVDIEHRKQHIMRDRAFLSLKVIRKSSTADVVVFDAEQNLFEETALLTHFVSPVNTTTDTVNKHMKIGLQVNFTAADIWPKDNMFEASIAVGIKANTADTNPADFKVYDCVRIKNSGVKGWNSVN